MSRTCESQGEVEMTFLMEKSIHSCGSQIAERGPGSLGTGPG